jgi:hypothetical protein
MRPTVIRACSLGILLLVGPAVPVHAADNGAAESDRYKSLLSDALKEYDAGRYQEARALFRQAHEIAPNARTLRGIGMASFELREYVEALGALEAALAEQRRALTPEQRDHVRGLIERTRAFVGRFRVVITPPQARLTVNGSPARLDRSGELRLAFGQHHLEASGEGLETEQRELRVVGGEEQTLTFTLRATPSVALETPTQPVVSERPSSSGARWWAVAVAGAGAAAAGGWWWHQRGELELCRDAGQDCGNKSALERRRTVAMGTALGLAGTAGALAVWAALSPSTESSTVAWRCRPGLLSATCAVGF